VGGVPPTGRIRLGTFGCSLVVLWRLDQMRLDQMTCYDGDVTNLR
jgi:hypothetical protein